MRIVGIDLGGTNLRAAAFDGELKIAEHRELVGEPRDPESIADRIARVAGQLGAEALGIGIAAMLRDDRGTVATSPHLRWRDVAFGELLAARLPSLPIGIYNDVNAITWGEVSAGAARGCRDVLAVYVGTGIGAGVVANGELVTGASHTAGELGHTKVAWGDDAAPCACGQRGCLEAYLGGSYLERRYGIASDVDAAAAAGDPRALEAWTELATLFAIALGNALAVLNPERLVVGGGVLAHCPTLVELTAAALEIAAPRASLEPLAVVAAELGDDAGLVGAARLVSRNLRRRPYT
ncbi:MAG TPA: ROK family protein [Kofleriaceae bacterium]